MCENKFKNTEDKKRREAFTKLFAALASTAITYSNKNKKAAQK